MLFRSKFRGKLPERLLQYWDNYGFCTFQNGLFFLVNPSEYSADVNAWIGQTSIVNEDSYHVIARTGFGELLLWGEKNGERYTINPVVGWIIEQDGHRSDISAGKGNEAMERFFITKSDHLYDIEDEDGDELFQRALAKHGTLAPDEVFAFAPAITTGGFKLLENISKRNVHVYLSTTSQLSEIRVMNKDDLGKIAFG